MQQGLEKNPANEKEAAIEQLRKAGFKITKKRKEIIDIFANNPRYLSAKFVHEQLSHNSPTLSYNTTYRNIYDFIELGILESIEYNQEQRFRINCLEPHHHHHHFICTNCGEAIPIEVCPMEFSMLQKQLEEVEVESHRFEIFGLCAQCH